MQRTRPGIKTIVVPSLLCAAWRSQQACEFEIVRGKDIPANPSMRKVSADPEALLGCDTGARIGVWLGTKVCAPALAESGKASPHGSAIVNLASIAGIVGSQIDPLYSMTEGGVTLFTKSAALSFGRKGWKIRVNSIHPGV